MRPSAPRQATGSRYAAAPEAYRRSAPGTAPKRRGGGRPPGPRDPRRVPPGERRPRGGKGRPPIRWRLRIAGALALAVITTSGLGHAMVSGVSGAIDRVDAFGGMQGRPAGTAGTNFLLVGTDGRDGLAPGDKERYHLGGAPCHCTDTMMLVHLSADHSRASVVSIPRDTYVRLPGTGPARASAASRRTGTAALTPTEPAVRGAHAVTAAVTTAATPTPPSPEIARTTHPAKINQAFAQGGPKLTVRTVEQLTGVHIDHYLEIDFTSFMKTVDVLGGVQVCTRRPLKDSYTGLDLPAGTSTLDGGQALQYVRSRHIDGTADLGRMQRQQRFLAQVIRKITSGGLLTDPVRLARAARTVLGSVRADQGLSTTDLIALAQSMKGFSPSSSDFAQVPLSNVNYDVPGIGSTVLWDSGRAGRLWAAIRSDRPLTGPAATSSAAPATTAAPVSPAPSPGSAAPGIRVEVDPATISVRIENGTAVNGLGATTQRALHDSGFAVQGLPTTAAHRATHTVIQYDPRWDRSAHVLATAVPGAELVASPGQGPVMRLTLGPGFTHVTPVTARTPATAHANTARPPAPGRAAAPGDARSGDAVGC